MLHFLSQHFRRVQTAPRDQATRPDLTLYIDAAVAMVDPRIRAVSRYQRALGEGTAEALQFASALAAELDEPLSCDSHKLSQDPRAYALFGHKDKANAVVHNTATVKGFFDDARYADFNACHIALSAQRVEKKGFGIALVNDMLVRDVAQTTLSFTEHCVIGNAGDETGARQTVRDHIFARLLTHAKQVYHHERTVLQRQNNVRRDLSPAESLALLATTLSQPNAALTLHHIETAIDPMMIKVNPAHHDPSKTLAIRFQKISGQTLAPFAVFLITAPRNNASRPSVEARTHANNGPSVS